MGLKHLLGAIWNGRPVMENGEPLPSIDMYPAAMTKFSVLQLNEGFLIVPVGQYGGLESGASYCGTIEELQIKMASILAQERMK